MADARKAKSEGQQQQRRFTVGLTLAETILIEDALHGLATSEAEKSDEARVLRARIHRSVDKQVKNARNPKKKQRTKSKPDAMFKRLPGSFESAQR